MPIVQLCGIRQKVHPKARCVLDAGPAEFLELFQNAAFVFTNSFHGTVFAAQFHVPFFTAVSPAELTDPESSRTFSLLSRLGLADRIVGQGNTADLEAPVDWKQAEVRLSEAAGQLPWTICALHWRELRILRKPLRQRRTHRLGWLTMATVRAALPAPADARRMPSP
ncbi:MAG: polysaccharide pyruvyl transferase family protein [Oscillospiraceae bacterium]